MAPRFRTACFVLFLVGFALTTNAQLPDTRSAQAPAAASTNGLGDPLGRDTPRGTIQGLNAAVARNDMTVAARYLQTTAAQRSRTDVLARDLNALMDRYFTQGLVTLSDAREGSLTDGLPQDQERIASLTIGRRRLDIDLVRVEEEKVPVWLVSAETLAQVPAAQRAIEATWLERLLPPAIADSTLLGVSLARWIVWAASIAVPLLLLWLLSRAFSALINRAIRDPLHRSLANAWQSGLRWPIIVVLTLGLHFTMMRFIGFSLRFRFIYARVALVASVIAVAYLLWRFSALSFAHARIMAQRRNEAGVRSLLMLAERVVKAVIGMVALFALLAIFGVDTTTALAGVGIGGLAVALGAQKSVENLLGGLFLLTDRVLAVGDTCSISNRLGVVEDITLRSVRLRTLEQTLLSVPAGVLSQETVENFTTRPKILIQSTLRLHYGTTTEQLHAVLGGIRTLLARHQAIESETARIRLVDFGVRAIELELFAYVLTPDMLRFLSVREDLLLQIAAIVEASGSGFAQPAQPGGEERDLKPQGALSGSPQC